MRKIPQARGGTFWCLVDLGTALSWAGPSPRHSAPQRCSTFVLRRFGSSFPESSGRAKDLCTTQSEAAAPHPPMVCFLSGGVEPSETLNDRCYLICCRSCWKIVWKALSTDRELEFQPTPAADRSFQAGSISIISPLREFCAQLSLQMIKHPVSGWKGNCLQRQPPMADAQDQKQVCKDWRGASLVQAHPPCTHPGSIAAKLGSGRRNHN